MRARTLRTLTTWTLASAVASTTTGNALADGDGTFSETYVERGPGLRAAAFGVGLAGRVPALPSAPVEQATIEIDLPDGAEVQAAYLYWVTYGNDSAATIDVDGDTLTGTLIGTSEGTCWAEYPSFENFVHRADVTDLVTGDVDLVLTNFPSGTPTADTQGASIFVAYTDPSDDAAGTVILNDGAMTMFQNNNASSTFTDVRPPAAFVGAELLFGVGDGQQIGADGSLTLKGIVIPVPSDGQHWRGSDGNYWDTRTYDITSRVEPTDDELTWTQNFSQDCLVFAFSGLAFRAAFVDDDDDGIDDAFDNCLGLANADQDDVDEDLVGDACDVCVDVADPEQEDGDADGVGDACDNCADVPNTDQADRDEDDIGDACDAACTGGTGGTGGEPGSGGAASGTGGAASGTGGASGTGNGGASGTGGDEPGATSASTGTPPPNPNPPPATTGGSGEGGDGDSVADASGDGCDCHTSSSSQPPTSSLLLTLGMVAWGASRRRRS